MLQVIVHREIVLQGYQEVLDKQTKVNILSAAPGKAALYYSPCGNLFTNWAQVLPTSQVNFSFSMPNCLMLHYTLFLVDIMYLTEVFSGITVV